MEIRNCIGDLLSEHDCVIIPGFGGFIGHYAPARIDPVTHTFFPPSKQLLFNINLRHNDGLLATEVSRITGLNYHNACTLINDFVTGCYSALQSGEAVIFPHVGRIFPGDEGTIQFEQNKSSNLLPESYGLNPFISPPINRSSAFVSLSKRESGKPLLRRRRSLSFLRKWAAILIIPVSLAALTGILKYDNLPARFSQVSPFFKSVLSKFSSTSMVDRKTIKPQETNLLPVVGGNDIKPAETKDSTLIVKPDILKVETTNPVTEKISDASENHGNSQNGYIIIIGAFRQKENAGKLVSELNGKGMSALIYDRSTNGLYRVALAALQSKEEAVQLLSSVQSSDFPDAWLLHK